MPDSPLVRLLNHPEVPPERRPARARRRPCRDGSVRAAEDTGDRLLLSGRSRCRREHGRHARRHEPDGADSLLVDTGDQVTHFHYFSRSDTARRLVAALNGHDGDFRTLAAPPSTVTSASYSKRSAFTRPAVVVLPGIMGSQLSLGDSPVWMNLRAAGARRAADAGHDRREREGHGLCSATATTRFASTSPTPTRSCRFRTTGGCPWNAPRRPCWSN